MQQHSKPSNKNFVQWVINRACQSIIESEGRTDFEFLIRAIDRFSVKDFDMIDRSVLFEVRNFIADIVTMNLISTNRPIIQTDEQLFDINQKLKNVSCYFLLMKLYYREINKGIYPIQ